MISLCQLIFFDPFPFSPLKETDNNTQMVETIYILGIISPINRIIFFDSRDSCCLKKEKVYFSKDASARICLLKG